MSTKPRAKAVVQPTEDELAVSKAVDEVETKVEADIVSALSHAESGEDIEEQAARFDQLAMEAMARGNIGEYRAALDAKAALYGGQNV